MIKKLLGLAIVAGLFAFGLYAALNNNKPVPDRLPANSTVLIHAGQALGSGVFIGPRTVLTVAHVVGSEQTVAVETEDGKTFTADVMWSNTEHDVAVVDLRETPTTPVSELACRSPELREPVEIIGNPMGRKFVHTWGRVAKTLEFILGHNTFVLQAPIAPGNSGGPIFDRHGFIIGIVDAVMLAPLSETDGSMVGIGFAIPATDICNLITISTGKHGHQG